MRATEFITEKWSKKYKDSINCNNPKGFSQRAHCAGRKKSEDIVENTQDFLYGDCPIFAIALSRMSGLPLKAMLDYSDELDTTVLVHAFVGYKDGLVIDASGVRSIESIEDDYPVEDDPYVTDISEKDLLALGYDGNCPTMDSANAHAKKVLADLKEPEVQKAIEENFADGKVKGKSRPGRVKKAGASCKGSVTDLRAKAKKYSGERAKMYHWCANMKSGRKKSKS